MIPSENRLPTLTVASDWKALFARGRAGILLQDLLPAYLKRRRWFGGRTRAIRSTEIIESVPLPYESPLAYLTLIQVEYSEGDTETYAVPFTFGSGEEAAQVQQHYPDVVAANLHIERTGEQGILYDAMRQRDFVLLLLESVAHHRSFRGLQGEIMAFPTRSFALLAASGSDDPDAEPVVVISEQSNTTVMYDQRFALKFLRRIEAGINPDLEIGRFLTEKVSLARAPLVAGALEYLQKNHESATLAVLRAYVPNQDDAWEYTQHALSGYFERVLARQSSDLPLPRQHVLTLAGSEVPVLAQEVIGSYLDMAQLLGQRTAEMHLALAQETEDSNFEPEPFTDFFQRPFYYAMLGMMDRVFYLLQRQHEYLPEDVQEDARRVLVYEQQVRGYFQPFHDRRFTAMRIRCHGNYHLGNVLRTDDDVVIIDFKGESGRSIEERRTKTSPLRDVASMLRSFHYAAYAALFAQESSGLVRTSARSMRLSWVRFWYSHVSAVFLRAYLDTVQQSPLLVQMQDEVRILLDGYMLEKAFYELHNELNTRPDWAKIPLRGILQVLEHDA